MRSILFFLCFFLVANLYAQPSVTDAFEKDTKSLNSRYQVLVNNSQNFTDYKVIKESYLNDFWKMVKDSLNQSHNKVQMANDTIAKLMGRISQQNHELEKANAEMTEMEHDSTHINAYGIDVHKGIFLTFFLCVIGGLSFLIVGLYGRVSFLQNSYSETKSTLDITSEEFLEYRRKTLDRQTKLSRELQDERNRLADLLQNS